MIIIINIMDDSQRLKLQDMIKTNDTQDQTDVIRQLKHSDLLRKDVLKFMEICKKHKGDRETIQSEGMSECNFLASQYTDIYYKLRADELDVGILFRFLDVLKKIEDGLLDQHEGSFEVGTLLKEMYVDSALKKAEKLNAAAEPVAEPKRASVNISWSQYKKNNM